MYYFQERKLKILTSAESEPYSPFGHLVESPCETDQVKHTITTQYSSHLSYMDLDGSVFLNISPTWICTPPELAVASRQR